MHHRQGQAMVWAEMVIMFYSIYICGSFYNLLPECTILRGEHVPVED